MKKIPSVIALLCILVCLASCAFTGPWGILRDELPEADMGRPNTLEEQPPVVLETEFVPKDITEALKDAPPEELVELGMEKMLEAPTRVCNSLASEKVVLENITCVGGFYFENGTGINEKSLYLLYCMDYYIEPEGYESVSGTIYHPVRFTQAYYVPAGGKVEFRQIDANCDSGENTFIKVYHLEEKNACTEVLPMGFDSWSEAKSYYLYTYSDYYDVTVFEWG